MDLLGAGPDSVVAECAARALHALAADSPAVQDALGAAGAVEPLVLILAAGPDQLAAKSAALAIGSLTNGNQGAPLSCCHRPIIRRVAAVFCVSCPSRTSPCLMATRVLLSLNHSFDVRDLSKEEFWLHFTGFQSQCCCSVPVHTPSRPLFG